MGTAEESVEEVCATIRIPLGVEAGIVADFETAFWTSLEDADAEIISLGYYNRGYVAHENIRSSFTEGTSQTRLEERLGNPPSVGSSKLAMHDIGLTTMIGRGNTDAHGCAFPTSSAD